MLMYVLANRIVTVPNTAAGNADGNNTSTKVISKNCAPFKNSITEISNRQINNVKDTNFWCQCTTFRV